MIVSYNETKVTKKRKKEKSFLPTHSPNTCLTFILYCEVCASKGKSNVNHDSVVIYCSPLVLFVQYSVRHLSHTAVAINSPTADRQLLLYSTRSKKQRGMIKGPVLGTLVKVNNSSKGISV